MDWTGNRSRAVTAFVTTQTGNTQPGQSVVGAIGGAAHAQGQTVGGGELLDAGHRSRSLRPLLPMERGVHRHRHLRPVERVAEEVGHGLGAGGGILQEPAVGQAQCPDPRVPGDQLA